MNPDVAVGFVAGRSVDSWFLVQLLKILDSPSGRERIDGLVLGVRSGPHLALGRTTLAEEFLATDRDWLLTVDTDMVPTPEDLAGLLAVADPESVPIVGAVYSSVVGELEVAWRTENPKLRFTFENDLGRLLGRADERGLVACDFVGPGFMLIHRRVYEAMDWRSWYMPTAVALQAEDEAFFERVAMADIPVHAHTGALVGHSKNAILSP